MAIGAAHDGPNAPSHLACACSGELPCSASRSQKAGGTFDDVDVGVLEHELRVALGTPRLAHAVARYQLL